MDFIPAKESRFYIWFFDWVTRFLLRLRFKKLWLNQSYQPGPNSRTVYFINHNLWWDGILPLFLNRRLFRQKARALMEDKQMKEHPFFSKIGAFSINLEDPRSGLRSLRYAVESMDRPNSCLFIYPEGELKSAGNSRPRFKEGVAWLYQQLEEVDFVPVAFHSNNFRYSKAELYIRIGKPLNTDRSHQRRAILDDMESAVYQLLTDIIEKAGKDNSGFKQI